jgi:hypothetical protein
MKWPILISFVVAALVASFLPTGTLGDCFGIASFACYALFPFLNTKRVRARWATFTILFSGLLGMSCASVYLMLHSGWLVVGSHTNHVIHTWLRVFCGILLGVAFTLIITGQLPGTKRDDQEIRHDPAT